MSRYQKGSIVVLPFPFSDLTATKKRPALVIADLEGDDLILCQITSVNRQDSYVISLNRNDLKEGNLRDDSLIRTNKIFTATSEIIDYELGKVNDAKLKEVEDKLVDIIRER